MRISHIVTLIALAISSARAVSVPNTDAVDVRDERAVSVSSSDLLAPEHALEKRKGGGGKGGGGGSSGGGKGSSGGGGSSGRTGPTANTGGQTRLGSGPPRAFGGGYYGGGAAVPYGAGKKTPKGLLAGALLAPAALLLLLPGIWLFSAFPYYYHNPYRFVNESMANETFPNGTNMSLPVICLCQEYNPCGCDENDDSKYLKDLIGNGSYDALNKSIINVVDNGTATTIVLNGTLPNGTTAPGGEDDAGIALRVGKNWGYYAMAMTVFYMCMFA